MTQDSPAPAAAPDLLWSRPEGPALGRLLLAHGAGAGRESAFMTRLTDSLVRHGIAVARFEFGYMAARRTGGRKTPPPKAERLVGEYGAAVAAFLAAGGDEPVLIAGKSMGGRVAVMAAGGDLPAAISGVVVYGYPFHPPGQPETWRLDPLVQSRLPVLILQGERDEFGSAAELADVALPQGVTLVPIEDGSHDFGPRGASPATLKGNIEVAAGRTRDLLADLAGR